MRSICVQKVKITNIHKNMHASDNGTDERGVSTNLTSHDQRHGEDAKNKKYECECQIYVNAYVYVMKNENLEIYFTS